MNDNYNFFPEISELEKLKTDGIHEYLWGGCFYNRELGFIDRIYHKRKDKVFGIYFEPSGFPGYLKVVVHNTRGSEALAGIIKNDFSQYYEEVPGGSFYLEGIRRSMEILKIRYQQVDMLQSEYFN